MTTDLCAHQRLICFLPGDHLSDFVTTISRGAAERSARASIRTRTKAVGKFGSRGPRPLKEPENKSQYKNRFFYSKLANKNCGLENNLI